MLTNKSCKEHGGFPLRANFALACSKCFGTANRQKLYQLMCDWCVRVEHVLLLQRALLGQQEQKAYAKEMEERWGSVMSEVRMSRLGTMSYQDLLAVVQRQFQHIGTKYQNDGLKAFLERNLSYLSRSTHLSIPDEVRPQIQDYLEAICSGKLAESDLQLTQLISKGCLQHDAIARALVPALLHKADMLRRGKHKRVAAGLEGMHVDPVGLAELGFALGQTLQLPSVLKAFGIPRSSCAGRIDYLRPDLPHFFCAKGKQLSQAISSALQLCDVQSTRAWMLCRDEASVSNTYQKLIDVVMFV